MEVQAAKVRFYFLEVVADWHGGLEPFGEAGDLFAIYSGGSGLFEGEGVFLAEGFGGVAAGEVGEGGAGV